MGPSRTFEAPWEGDKMGSTSVATPSVGSAAGSVVVEIRVIMVG